MSPMVLEDKKLTEMEYQAVRNWLQDNKKNLGEDFNEGLGKLLYNEELRIILGD